MTCRKCGTEIAAKAIICYKCGTASAAPAARGSNVGRGLSPGRPADTKVPAYIWTIIVVLAVVAAAVWWFQYR